MYKIEKIGEDIFYLKALGTMPPSVIKNFINDFDDLITDLDSFSSIVDGMDMIILNLKSFKILLKFLKKNNKKLRRSAYVMGVNPVLNKEAEILLEKAKSPKRKIFQTLDEAKEWIGIDAIILKKK